MNYKVQINWRFPDENGWATVSKEVSTLEQALKKLEYDSNLARVCAPLRVIDDDLVVHARWNTECDWRLPGCLWRRTQERAYKLWKDANPSDNDSEKFWFEAERQLLEEQDNGLREGDFTQEEIDMFLNRR